MISDPEAALREFDQAPVVCNFCEAAFEMPLNDKMRGDLIASTYYHGFQEELSLLDRTRALADHYPSLVERLRMLRSDDRHDVETPPSADEQETLDIALKDDPGLAAFVRSSRFDLERRLAFVKGSVRDLSSRRHEFQVICPRCRGGTLRLTEEFFKRL